LQEFGVSTIDWLKILEEMWRLVPRDGISMGIAAIAGVLHFFLTSESNV
jgi:hypothetical protein